MDFFEELTRYKLLKGNLPLELLYTPEQLDALAAAYTAYRVGTKPAEVIRVGDLEEGQIVLPVRELKTKY
jgi:predicted RNase H-like nuclease